MYSTNLMDSAFRGVCKAAENNMRLQQELLMGWTRFWPGFSGRGSNPVESARQVPQLWSDSMFNVARAQQELFAQQFEAAVSSLEPALGVATEGNGTPPAAEQPSTPVPSSAVAAPPAPPQRSEEEQFTVGTAKNISQKVAVVTGAGSGIGEAVSHELVKRGARAVLMVDRSESVVDLAASINESAGRTVAIAKIGDTTDEGFRKRVFSDAMEEFGPVTICVPAAGIARDSLAVRMNKETGKAEVYPIETFRQVTEVNLLAPIYWAIEMVACIAEDRRQRGVGRWEPEERVQGVIVFLGSVSSQGNKGQISYAVTKAGLEGAAATLQKEAIFHGVRCGIIHPGFTDTPMARALGDDYLSKNVLPYTQLRRLIRPEEIADAICFMISNSAVSGELWADAGWHPPA